MNDHEQKLTRVPLWSDFGVLEEEADLPVVAWFCGAQQCVEFDPSLICHAVTHVLAGERTVLVAQQRHVAIRICWVAEDVP